MYFQSKKNKIGFIKLLMIIEFVQNIELCFPQHGWQQIKYDDKMLNSLQQIINFLNRNPTEYQFEVFIISLSLIYFIMLILSFNFQKSHYISQLISITLNIFQKILGFHLFFYFIFDVVGFNYISLERYRNQFQQELLPSQFVYTPQLRIIYTLDLIRILVFVIVNTQTGFIIFSLLTIITKIIVLYHNVFQQNDPEKFNQGLLICNLIISVFLLLGLIIAQF
ncbi:unnamed protein product [Paramecium octaurelia]|uniref:Transmembrane protein n=1 Tax=Paramecium octaurelia TaxID=43137 RepID=A0A8S1RSW8_PAROT|nr:unnamed protein product [Paramecium octaurelia]